MYCFVEEYKDTVFASNPESCVDHYVYPLAANFKDFMRLIVSCGTANPVEQIIWMDKEQFDQHLLEERGVQTEQQKELLCLLGNELNIVPMEEPFEYVKNIQNNFSGSNIKYIDEYYNILEITR